MAWRGMGIPSFSLSLAHRRHGTYIHAYFAAPPTTRYRKGLGALLRATGAQSLSTQESELPFFTTRVGMFGSHSIGTAVLV